MRENSRRILLAVSSFFQDVVLAEPGGVGRLDLVPQGPRLGWSDRPWRKSVPQAARSVGFHTHGCLLPALQAHLWEVSFLQLSAASFSSCASFWQTAVRLFRKVACPLASLLGVRDKKRVCAPPNPVLEAFFCSTSKHPTQVHTHTHTHTLQA